MDPDSDDVLQEQIAYYRARAPEYDEAYFRIGPYDRGEERNQRWRDEISQMQKALVRLRPTGRVLEFACGSGWWTQQLVQTASELVAVDASAEMIELAKERVRGANVRFIESDIFRWKSDDQFDMVFFAFWLTHVPDERFDEFWENVRNSLKPGGTVFFIDDYRQYGFGSESRRRLVQPREFDDGTVIRRLNDGREFRIVKTPRSPEELSGRLDRLGWETRIEPTETWFFSAQARLIPK